MLTQIELQELDLCVLLGMTLHQMKSSITDEEFKKWQEYMMVNPSHATDIQIAQLTLLVSAFMGNKDASFDDFYVHRPQEEETVSIKTEDKTQEDNDFVNNYVLNAYR